MASPSRQEALIARARACLLGNYRWQPLAIQRGEGVRVWDADGRQYLDMLGGIATCALGHCHPEVMAAAKAQLERLWHISNVFVTEPEVELAEQLTSESGLDRAFFCNSGAEANEAMFKLARRVMKDRGQPERYEVLSFEGSFHGRTLATVAATGQPKHQQGFEPLPAGFRHVPFGDLGAVKAAVGPKTAAIIDEAIQGEGGVRVASEGFLGALRNLCDERGLLLFVDEVQTGMGRTGRFFGYQRDGIRPDAVSMAKALGNGLPIAAMLCREELSKSLPPGSHGSTFGGNPVAAAAANVAVRIIRRKETLAAVSARGEQLMQGARAVAEQMPERISAVRGAGLLVGVELKGDAAAVVARCREGGMLVNLAGEKTVRLAPPFIVSESEVGEALAMLQRAIESA